MSEDAIVHIFNEDNVKIGEIPRKNLTTEHKWRIICVWIENDKGETLLQQRSLKKTHGPGLWTVAVEGTVENDDSFEETARREIEEEIGLKEFTMTTAKRISFEAATGWRDAQGYIVRCNWPIEKFTVQASEVEKLQWKNKKDVISKMKAQDPKYPKQAPIWLEMFDLV